MISETTRRFEHGMPLLATMDLGVVFRAWGRVAGGDPQGVVDLVTTLGKPAELRVLRKLSAIWQATDVELKCAETDPKVLEALEELAAGRPMKESFKDSMDFFVGAAESLGVSLSSSSAAETAVDGTKQKATRRPKKITGNSPSGG